MKTLFNALRAAIFGAGFISLWGWVALGCTVATMTLWIRNG